jgi:hypothetical protein
VLAGQTILSLAQPIFAVNPTKMAAEWFPVDQRPLATALASLSTAMGSLCGFIFSPMVLHGKDVSNPADARHYIE